MSRGLPVVRLAVGMLIILPGYLLLAFGLTVVFGFDEATRLLYAMNDGIGPERGGA